MGGPGRENKRCLAGDISTNLFLLTVVSWLSKVFVCSVCYVCHYAWVLTKANQFFLYKTCRPICGFPFILGKLRRIFTS